MNKKNIKAGQPYVFIQVLVSHNRSDAEILSRASEFFPDLTMEEFAEILTEAKKTHGYL